MTDILQTISQIIDQKINFIFQTVSVFDGVEIFTIVHVIIVRKALPSPMDYVKGGTSKFLQKNRPL